jgi:hypothetical protein
VSARQGHASAGSRLLTVGAVSVALFAGGHASAQDGREVPEAPSISQYVEDVPTASGAAPAAPSSRPGGVLPSRIRERIAREGGADAKQLEELATSSGFGAPQQSRAGDGSTADSASPGSLSAAASALDDQDGGELSRILIVMLAITIAGVLAAAVGQRRRQ